ncbi:MAG: type II secretion system protein [Phycisphaeraceae bacterium]
MNRGFSLIELVLVLAILSVIAAIAIPRMSIASDGARITSFATTLRQFARACELYHLDHKAWPPDGSSGLAPSELKGYVDEQAWANPTPLGGEWDNETADAGSVTAAIGVHFDTSDATTDALMRRVDKLIDDGALISGSFRKLASGRYYFILEESDTTANKAIATDISELLGNMSLRRD